MKHVFITLLAYSFVITSGVMAQKIQINSPDKGEVAKLVAAIEANPDSLNFHKAYIDALGIDNPVLPNQYQLWMKKFPKSVIVPFAIGNGYRSKERPIAKRYLLEALKIDPKYAEAWDGLALDALRWGNFAAADEYQKKAAEASPLNDMLAYYYLDTFVDKDMAKHQEMVLDFLKRFPGSNICSQAVNKLVEREKTNEEKIKQYEFFRGNFPLEQFRWMNGVMSSYFTFLLDADTEKAASLASEMQKARPTDKSWADQLLTAQNLLKIKQLIAANNGAEALTLINGLKPTRGNSAYKTNLLLLKVNATALSGGSESAYKDLLALFIKSPKEKFKREILKYGAQSGKSTEQIAEDIRVKLEEQARPATAFTLKRYLTSGTTSLSDYKGKVILLTYWFPGCGPCRGEFPHFENVIKKFKGKNVDYVGINVVPMQNEYVIPFVKSTGYSFTPLEDVVGREKGNLDNKGAAPANFVIDQLGRVVFSDFSIDEENEDELENMISLLLAKS